MTVYHGPWVWQPGAGPGGNGQWSAPAGCTGGIDLRNYDQHRRGDDGGGGNGLFECPSSPGGGYLALADGALDTVIAARRTSLGNRLGVAIAATRLGPIISEILSVHADPTGVSRWKPLVPVAARIARFYLGSIAHGGQVGETDPEWVAARGVLRLEYARIRALVQAGLLPPGTHLRHLGKWLRRYLLSDHTQFLNGLPDEGMLDPQTSVSDDFNRADGDAAGSLWTERNGDFDIVSNRLKAISGQGNPNACHITTWGGTADYYAQAIINLPSGSWDYSGLGVRRANYSTSDSDSYQILLASTTAYAYKRVSGSYTALSSVSGAFGGATATDYTIKFDVAGSVQKIYVDGVQKGINGSDTAISAAGDPMLKADGDDAVSWDDFIADDGVAGGGGTKPRLALLGVG